MYQSNDEGTDATYQIGQKLANFLDDCILPAKVLHNTAQQNESVKDIESMMLTDLSNCDANNSNQNLHTNEFEHQMVSQVSIQSMAVMNDIDLNHANNENSPNENPESIELRDLLQTWNLESLADHLIGENVFIPVLKVIKRHHIELLMKQYDIGTYIMFEHQLEKWRDSIGLPLMNQCGGKSNINFSSFSNPSTSPSTSHIISRESTPTRFMPYERPITPEEYISLADILNATHKGLMLTEYYTKFNKFKEEQRILLVGLIAGYYEEKSLQLTLALSHRLEQEILERFPTEKLEFYRVAKRGKIYNKYCNMKSTFKSAVSGYVVQSKTKTKEKETRHEKNFEPEDNAESCIRCLKYDNLSVEEFDQCWRACSRYRLTQIKKLASTKSIMETWPFYKTPSGYCLIDIDYKISFDDNDGLILNWDNYFDTLVKFLSSDGNIKDKKIKGIVENVRKTPDLSENGKNAAIFWALHGYFVPTKLVVLKKDNKKTNTKYTIKDSQESFVFVGKSQQEVEDHLLHIKSMKTSIQPFICCVGEDILNISNISVYFDDIRYNFKNFVRAVDICYKIIYLFDLEFPPACLTFYSFIESFFYNFKSKHNTSKVHILSDYLNNTLDNEQNTV